MCVCLRNPNPNIYVFLGKKKREKEKRRKKKLQSPNGLKLFCYKAIRNINENGKKSILFFFPQKI